MLDEVKNDTSSLGTNPEINRFHNNILMCAEDEELLREWIGRTNMGRVMWKVPRSELPTMINHRLLRIKTVVRWRLSTGK